MAVTKLVLSLLLHSSLALSAAVDVRQAVEQYIKRQQGGQPWGNPNQHKPNHYPGTGCGSKRHPPPSGDPGGIFEGINPAPTLQFQPCYNYTDPNIGYSNEFQCARLLVPLDYSRRNSDTFALSVLKIPAIDTTQSFQGAFIMNQDFSFNTDFLQGLGAYYQLDGFTGFDFYAFDTRGTGHSTPQLTCFPDDATFNSFAAASYNNDVVFGAFNGTFPPTESNIRTNIQKSTAFASQMGADCNQYYGKYLPYMSSADAARDMNNIINQLPRNTFINIYNYGYATVLGSTFAALYPNSFDRMILDGTVDASKVWSGGDNDPVTVQDSNKAEQAWFDSCVAAGPCQLSDVNGSYPGLPVGDCLGCYFWESTSDAVKARFEALKAKYYTTPFKSSQISTVCGTCDAPYDAIAHGLDIDQPAGYGAVQGAVLSSLRLLEWELGYAVPNGAIEWFAYNYGTNVTFYPPDIAQRCVDQPSVVSGTAALESYMKAMNASYNGLGPAGTARREVWCTNWPASAANPFPPNGFQANRKIRTRGPILFVANDMDGRHALANAQAMSGYFSNSAVLTVNAMGDTSFFSGYSAACVPDYESAYTINGTLPPPGAFCNDVIGGISGGAFGVPYQKDYR